MTATMIRPADWPADEVIGDDDCETMWIPVAVAPTLRDAVRHLLKVSWMHDWTRRELIQASDRVHLRRMDGEADREACLASIGVDITETPYWEQCSPDHPFAFPAWRFG